MGFLEWVRRTPGNGLESAPDAKMKVFYKFVDNGPVLAVEGKVQQDDKPEWHVASTFMSMKACCGIMGETLQPGNSVHRGLLFKQGSSRPPRLILDAGYRFGRDEDCPEVRFCPFCGGDIALVCVGRFRNLPTKTEMRTRVTETKEEKIEE